MKINIKGPIISDGEQFIYDWFDIPATSPSSIAKHLRNAAENETIEVIVNSGGGNVFSGSEIYTMLMEHKGDVVVKIVGVAASAASVIAMAGKKILMSPTAQIMIHNSAASASGDCNALEHTAELLRSVDSGIASSYQMKTGMSHDELLNLMAKETWMGPQQALEYKFIDGIMFSEDKVSASINLLEDGTLPKEVIDKMRNELKGIPQITNSVAESNKTQVKVIENTGIELSKMKLKLKLKSI